MRIAHGLFMWQEPREVLEPCLRSTAPYVDEMIIAEGLIEGVPDLGLGAHTDISWLAEPSDWLPAHINISSRGSALDQGLAPWKTISQACTWILHKAQVLGCEWLLFVDADQELHNGAHLRAWLESYDREAFPLPRLEPPDRPGGRGYVRECPWQLIRTSAFIRYVAGCYILARPDGNVLSLVPDDSARLDSDAIAGSVPWLSHHPERRPPWRRSQRLGAYETILEPPPPATPLHSLAGVVRSQP